MVVDELHVVTEPVWDAMALVSGKRDRSLVLGIRTPGVSPDSVMWRLVQHGREGADPSLLCLAPRRAALDTADDSRGAVRRYRLGQWAGAVGGWIDWSAWADRTALVDGRGAVGQAPARRRRRSGSPRC